MANAVPFSTASGVQFFQYLMFAIENSLHIVPDVMTEWRPMALAAVLVSLVLLCGGCSGINSSIGVSPATFLLPGFVQESSPVPESESFVAKESEITVAQGK